MSGSGLWSGVSSLGGTFLKQHAGSAQAVRQGHTFSLSHHNALRHRLAFQQRQHHHIASLGKANRRHTPELPLTLVEEATQNGMGGLFSEPDSEMLPNSPHQNWKATNPDTLIFFLLCFGVCVCVHVTAFLWRSEDNL